MSLVVLGLSGALTHDSAAAIYVNGELVAAAEEERFTREKHAKNVMPLRAARYCMSEAGIRPRDIDLVAFPFAPISLFGSKARWHYARRHWYAPERAAGAIFAGNRHYWRNVAKVKVLVDQLGMSWQDIEFVPVEHHVAHASSAYFLSGFEGRTGILGIDGKGEYATTFFGSGIDGRIRKEKEFFDPDSLGQMYAAFTEYLGFEMLEGEHKVMGMAPYGDASKYDLSQLARFDGHELQINTELINTCGLRRFKEAGKSFGFSQKLVDWLGPRRAGDIKDDPYVHYAAAIQKLYEDITLQFIDSYLKETVSENGQLVFAGGGAQNIKLNQRIRELPYVKELFVQPAAGDAGTAIGAASWASAQQGVKPKPLQHLYLGPGYSNEQCMDACDQHPQKPFYEKCDDVVAKAAALLTRGHPVAWCQGRMEFGPRALGGRSILGCPGIEGVAEKINEKVKYRESWHPFCPSILDSIAEDVIQTAHPAPYMTMTFDVAPDWIERMPEVVHKDGTSRVQVVTERSNPRYYALLQEVERLTGTGAVLNTSMNRRGEPMVCTPTDSLNMFFGSDLDYLVLEDLLITKRELR